MFKKLWKKKKPNDPCADWRAKGEKDQKFTKADFVAVGDEELIDACLAWTEKFDIYKDAVAFKNAPLSCRNFLSMFMLDAQVNNGGFNQFYFNGYGNLGIDYFKAFEDMGLTELSKLVQEADKVHEAIKHTLPKNDDNRDLEEFSKSYDDNPLNDFDDKYYDLEQGKEKQIIKYIRENIDSFGD